MNKAIGILGGTFDPVHNGHLAVAEFVMNHCPLSEIQFVPCLLPPHRTPPQASANDRLAMLKLAIEGHDHWSVNDIDFHRPPPSYMIDTLSLIKQKQPQTPLCLILGMDAFNGFNRWRQWTEILQLAHLIIVNRPGFSLSTESWITELLAERMTNSCQAITHSSAGLIVLLNMPPEPISATKVRTGLADDHFENLPAAVMDYIKQRDIYFKRKKIESPKDY